MPIEKTIAHLVEAWNDQDVDAIVAVFAADGAYHEPAGPDRCGRTHVGHAAIRAALERVFATFPDGVLTPVGALAVAGDQAHCEWDFAWTTRSGERRVTRGVDVFTFEHGLLKHKSAYLKQYAAA
ncbi:MAG: nuclear transport factor 2 family protein [Gammaproteobacteria bacterium]